MARRILFAGSFLLFPLIFLFPYLLGKKLLGGADFEDYYLPLQQFLSSQIKTGHFPYWNPLALLGKPTWGDPENAFFYPPRWILFWNPEYTITLYAFFHFAWAHVGGYRVARELKLERFPAWVSGFAFSYCGWSASHFLANHSMILAVESWVPHILATLLSFSKKERWAHWVIILFFQGLMLTQAGAPQTAYYGAVFLMLSLVSLRPQFLIERKFIFGVLLAAFSAALVAAPQGIGTSISHAESVRAGDYPWDRAIWFRLLPGQLSEFWTGLSLQEIARKTAEVYETGVFVGPVVLLSALLALLRKEREVWILWGVALLFLLLGMAEPPWLLRLFRLLPGAGSFRSPGRFLIHTMLVLSLLSGLGWKCLCEKLRPYLRPKFIPFLEVGWAAAILLPLAVHFYRYVPEGSERFDELRGKLAATARNLTGEKRPRVFLGAGPLRPNQFHQEGIEMVSGRAPLLSWRYVNYVSGPTRDAYWIEMYPSLSPRPHTSLSLLAAPLFFSTGKEEVADSLKPLARISPYIIYGDPSASPRVRFFPKGIAVRNRIEARDLLWKGTNALEELWYEGPAREGYSPASKGSCQYRIPSTDRYEIDCETTGPGFVWISQAYFPGWQATVNGTPAPLYPAHLLFQTVPIPSGKSFINVEYHPQYLGLSLLLALIGFAIPNSLLLWRRK